VALFFVQRYYLRTSKQVSLLEIEAKAPLYAHFMDTISGHATIRAYHLTPVFSNKLGKVLDRSQNPLYMLFLIQQWLTLVLDLMVGALAVVLVAIAMSVAGTDNGIGAGTLGAALILLLQFNGLLIQVSRVFISPFLRRAMSLNDIDWHHRRFDLGQSWKPQLVRYLAFRNMSGQLPPRRLLLRRSQMTMHGLRKVI
jgi:ABC-type multidrug transport system fused ATPase/permease subunit